MNLQYKILCVDDEAANLRLLVRLFRDTYEVHTAEGGVAGLELLAVHDFALIISDQRMPGMPGIDFLKKAAEMRRQTVRIMLTGYTDAETLVEAVNSGVVYKYVNKPWVNDDLAATVKRALQHYETMKGQRQLQLQNERLQASLKAARDAFIEILMQRLEAKDLQARAHASRTRDHAVAIGEAMGMDRPELEMLGLAAYLHETPLVGLTDEKLHMQMDFTDRDYRFIESCFEDGLELFERVRDLDEIASVLRFQFEHFDGSGRPRGFSHEQIPVHARILAVANAYDSMTAPRNGDTPLTSDEALRMLTNKSQSLYDGHVVNVLCDVKKLSRQEIAHQVEHGLIAA